MYYGELKKCDIANGIGVRVTLFVSGCRNRCPDCFQPQTWDFRFGQPFTEETAAEIYTELSKSYIAGLTVLGGEPFEPENQRELVKLLKKVKADFPTKTIWVFTGYRLDDELWQDDSHPHCEVTDEMLSYIDVLVDGRFMAEQKDISLQFRGSRNQRVIDMNKTRETGVITIWEQLRR
ncbi:MAG: anaerobic ribonucleoside-triphosphate reductase activating protein [Eubacteriales bacterium]|nr:anaerobic ribonucleoside-triphosphate reductase activating protein [Eubacteriales bacterium]